MRGNLEGLGDLSAAVAADGDPSKLTEVMKAQTENLNGGILINQNSIPIQPIETSRMALSPTPRKSERERKIPSYDKLNKGAPNSEEDSLEFNKDFGGGFHHQSSNIHHQKDKSMA